MEVDVAEEVLAPSGGDRPSAWSAFKRAALLLGAATLVAVAIATAVFVFVFQADFLTGAASAVARVMFEHSALAVAAAASPIFGALLVGYGYMIRGMRRRAAEKAAAAAAAREPSPG